MRFVAFLFLASAALTAQAQDCSDYPNGLLDGFAGTIAPSQLQIDRTCTIRNYPASNPLDTNFSFLTQPGQTDQRWVVIFDNVVHTGQMACNSVAGHKIWFTNGSSSTIQESCQNLLIPVEKIDKQNPDGQTTASVGVPFTYRLTMPVLFDPATGAVINTQGSLNDLHSVTVWDDLNATGADLTYLNHVAYWKDTGAPVSHTFANQGGELTFDNFPVIPAGQQIILEITVVLDDSPVNVPGTEFVNTAKWDFGRLIDGEFFEPLPGEWGITEPMTVAGPELVMTKSGPATLNIGESGTFTLDLQNTGNGAAWNTTIVDRLPNGPSGGMCDAAPQILGAQVFEADGVTAAPGQGPLVPGTDFTLAFSGTPACELMLGMLGSATRIGPGQRLIVEYSTRLDIDTRNAVALTNVAGATQWFNGESSVPGRQTFMRTLTDGTVGTQDHEDAHTVTADLSGFLFEKTVANLTSGASPAATAAPGDTLRYTLRIRTTDTPLDGARILDDLGALNTSAVFAPGTLSIVAGTLPPGADASNTNTAGGTNGAGLLDIRNLSVPADSDIALQFDATLQSAIPNGTVVLNQAELIGTGKLADSDDPNVNGGADPEVDGDEDPTRITIVSVPAFVVEKVSSDVTGDPSVLLAGDTLRYLITVRNAGTDIAADAFIRDQIPANTSYVAGSTTLNGVSVPDPAAGFPLAAGIPVNGPGAPAGTLAVGDTATIAFDVMVGLDVADGTIVSNQAFVSAPAGGVMDQPSDDPATPAVNDPTRDIVGNFPLLFAEKSLALQTDLSSPGLVDPNDVLRYTIAIHNNGAIPATGVDLADSVPANTTYVADSLTLNGEPVGRPDNGVSPLAAGIPVSTSDLTPPLPTAGNGVLTPGETAVVQFDLRVNDGVPSGTLISNQAVIGTAELPDLLTDGDGNPATGPEPTVAVVGDAQQLSISKQVAVVGGGPAIAGATLEYVVTVTNIAAVPAYQVKITDDLDLPEPGRLAYVDPSATMNGLTTGITVNGSLITADYFAAYGPLDPGETIVLRFRATLDPALAIGTIVTNTATAYWNDPQRTANASVSIVVGGVPGSGTLSGAVWHDTDYDDAIDAPERLLAGWTVELWRDGRRVNAIETADDGRWRMVGVAPNYLTDEPYSLVFVAPSAGPSTAALGLAASDFTNGLQRIDDVVVDSGAVLQDLNLPIDPDGVVYDAVVRSPIAGVALALLDAAGANPLPDACFDDPNQQGQVTLAQGWYKFDLNFSDPACPAGSSYLIRVTPQAGYVDGESEFIPAASDATTASFDVPGCPGSPNDALPATAEHCEAQASELPPPVAVPARDSRTAYHLNLRLDDSRSPGSAQLFNNHIPVDPRLEGSVSITKTTPMVNVTRGQLVPYVITVSNSIEIDLHDVSIVDRFPTGFRYVEGSARFDGEPTEPAVSPGELLWTDLTLAASGRHTLKLLLAVGAGVTEGEFVNRARVDSSLTGNPISGEAQATVRLVPDPTFDCTDVTGKVFDDFDRNGYQNGDETGLPGVRVVTARGLAATTDAYGRFHFTCPITPHEMRGSNFVLKLDDRTLPSGYRASTELVQIKRATRGKALHFSFGASIHRVVGLDLSDPVFHPGSTEIRRHWQYRFDLLIDELKKGPAVLRLSYLADVEDERLVERRLEAIQSLIMHAWTELDCCYELAIEPEVYWRLGAPPDLPDQPGRESR